MRTVDLTIESIAFGGKGVAHQDGKAVFVPFTIDGENVLAKIVREKKHFAEAEIVEVKRSSPHRVKPECPYFGRCGGCGYQHVDYRHQLAVKWQQVRETLERIGKIKDIALGPIVPAPKSYGYRNRITVHAQNGIIGYFRRDSHRLIDIERCPIAMDEVNLELAALRRRQPHDGHYTLRAGGGTSSVSSGKIRDDTEVVPPARIFTQTNDAVAIALRELITQMIPDHHELLIDAYCGAGFFAKALRDKFERIIGIDWDKFAIDAARKDATEKETYFAGEVEIELQNAGAVCLNRPPQASKVGDGRLGSIAPTCQRDKTVLIVDPPSIGLSRPVRKIILDLAPAFLIYVSCNPATLARDLMDLRERLKIESVTPLDMFPQTAEIEVVAYLRRSDDSTI